MKLNNKQTFYPSKLIPFEPSNLYKSLEYLIKKVMIEHKKLNFHQLIDCLKQFKENNNQGEFQIPTKIFNKKRIITVLSHLCKEKKLVKRQKYFQNYIKNSKKIFEIVKQYELIKKCVC